ncbi:WD-40 repeat protein [Trypanosoma conorhini]|uniref:WD-40 repeat protein n=1 Tax=Trypanosoma conorhini TaxID=83891 RepID=A0A422NQL5_9TRYP|nr:WD-40 repeat protein [Trypanosoma conorhini]RNF07797.1 WD-40 repeat protein [Trypanosoma conorhini]
MEQVGEGGRGGHHQGRFRHRGQEYDEYVPRRKIHGQRCVDFYSSAIRHVTTRLLHRNTPYGCQVEPHPYYSKDMLPAAQTPFNPSTALCTQWVNTSFHPDSRAGHTRVPLMNLKWAPNGRRLLCSTGRGEFLLFNGHSFGLEVKTVAHEDHRPCRAITWGNHSNLIISGDDAGIVKLWLSNFVLVAVYNSHHRAVREVTWAPLEGKFCTCGQDGSARVWDTNAVGTNPQQAREEVKLEGHGGDVVTVDWHPFHSLILTGSQDRDCRLWDPRTASRGSIAALQGHAQSVNCVRWNPNGTTLLSASKDCTVKLWDIRMVQEIASYEAHSKSVERVEWHPQVQDLFVSAGADGNLMYWLVDAYEVSQGQGGFLHIIHETAAVESAHDRFRDVANPVNAIAWDPLGNLLASCSTEVKYWHRNKPGAMEEKERGEEDDVFDMADQL